MGPCLRRGDGFYQPSDTRIAASEKRKPAIASEPLISVQPTSWSIGVPGRFDRRFLLAQESTKLTRKL